MLRGLSGAGFYSLRFIQKTTRTLLGSIVMSTLEYIFAPPASVRGMVEIDRSAFVTRVTVPAVKTTPKQCSTFLHQLKHVVLRYPGVKKIIDCKDDKSMKLLLLIPEQSSTYCLSDDDRRWISDNSGILTEQEICLDYKDFTMNAILRAVLPAELEQIPTAFETVGHIAHLNLRDNQLPYKKLIGEVLLDKQPAIESVVNKTNAIDETFRFFKMELLAGSDNMEATVKENGCTFVFDFSKVYWNSRLHEEHARVTNLFRPGDTVLDVFAGVGPFAIPACKKKCTVHANDLNPNSYTALIANARRNGVVRMLRAYNLDGRLFLRDVGSKLVSFAITSELDMSNDPSRDTQEVISISHIIMNLPASAVEFLDALRGLFASVPEVLKPRWKLPQVHCYCFSKSAIPCQDALEAVERHLGTKLEPGSYEVVVVRDVAPNKLMMRVSFRLPSTIAFTSQPSPLVLESQAIDLECQPPLSKRSCLDQ